MENIYIIPTETLEEAAIDYSKNGNWDFFVEDNTHIRNEAFVAGAKWQAERMYSEEDMKQFGLYLGDNFKKLKDKTIDEIFEQFKKK